MPPDVRALIRELSTANPLWGAPRIHGELQKLGISVTVEHVLPQTPAEGSRWMTWFPGAEERAAWVNRVGNLALLTRKKNSSASNYEFDTKKTTQVLQYQDWTPIVVTSQKQILETFNNHWRLV